jgi:MFS family permease
MHGDSPTHRARAADPEDPLQPAAARAATEAREALQPWPRPRTAWYALIILTLATMMNFFGAYVFPLMVQSVKRDFALSDIEIGLLLGPAGIFFFIFVGIPLARLVDLYPRRIILGIGLIFTSACTVLGGLAQNYAQMFASRIFVGVGGSAHGPGCYSMIADYFPPAKLPRAIAVLQFGFIFGTGLASLLGGALLGMVAGWRPTAVGPLLIRNWQWVLIMVGTPGLVIAALVYLLPEPARRGRLAAAATLTVREVFREIARRRTVYFPLFLGLALSSIEAGGLMEWRPAWMMRTYGWTAARVGFWQGITFFIGLPLGILFGTWLTERLARRHEDANVRVTTILFTLAIPCAVVSPLLRSGLAALILGSMSGVFGVASAVPQNAAIQTITPNEMRGQVTAVYLFMFTVFQALGSLFIAAFNQFVVGAESGLWKTLCFTAAIIMPLAAWAISRGVRPYGAEIARLEAEGRLRAQGRQER